MTQEEKAKAYDDIIERLKDFQFEYRFSPFSDVIGDKFPELKESEDERIRKALITTVIHASTVYGATREEVLAWLKKQKEPKYLDTSTCEPWSDEQTRRNLINFLKSLGATEIPQASYNRYLSYLEKQGEQKPVEPQQDMLSQEQYAKAVDECVFGEQKPAWSEEDEIMFRKAIITIDNVRMNTDSQEYYQGICDWLKSLKDRVVPQPKNEWSEENERMFDMIISDLERHGGKEGSCYSAEINWLKSFKDRVQPQSKQEWSGGDEAHLHSLITHLEQWIESNPDTTGADIQGENIAWLKSLSPQMQCSIDGQELQKNLDTIFKAIDKAKEELRKGNNGAALDALCIQYPGIPIQKQWKPSDEQMQVLSNAGNSYRPFEEGHKVLWSLYNDLKKLRE